MCSEVSLEQMLAARDNRADRQNILLEQYHLPLICLTMNIAGPIKNNRLIREGFRHCDQVLAAFLRRIGANIIYEESCELLTGNESIRVVEGDPLALKKLAVELEEQDGLGRLMDIDIIAADGMKADRSAMGRLPRTCLLCGEAAAACARSRRHSVSELQQETDRLLHAALDSEKADRIAQLAVRGLLFELGVTPKPGLVDRANNGSHEDMDFFLLTASATQLAPYFRTCALLGIQNADQPAEKTFHLLRYHGKCAEDSMFAATGGVNTHKGAIFSLGILCAAAGRLAYTDRCYDAWAILDEGQAMAGPALREEIAGLDRARPRTAGERIYVCHGLRGVRGQVMDGFPGVRTALPVLEHMLEAGYDINTAGYTTLLHLIAVVDDTNLISRSDPERQSRLSRDMAELLRTDPAPDQAKLTQIDQSFIAERLSPGGCADLLSIIFFLYFLQTKA